MSGLINFFTAQSWTDTITIWFYHVDNAYNRLIGK